jgi:hypothetical protein
MEATININKSTAKNFLSRSRVARAVLLAGALLTLGVAQSARADTMYTYTGQAFSYRGGPGTQVTGSFTVSSPLGSSTTQTLTPASLGGTITSYDFTDGSTVWDLGNYVGVSGGLNPFDNSQFSITTDASGKITSWFLNIYSPVGLITTCNTCNSGGAYDDTSVFYNYDGYNFNSPGTWSDPPAAMPEPTSGLLLTTGLLGLGIMVLRR